MVEQTQPGRQVLAKLRAGTRQRVARKWSVRQKVMAGLDIVIVVLLVIIGLRPKAPNGEVLTYQNNLDIIFVLDNTLSMLAEDYSGKERRIDGVIADVEEIVEQIPGAYYSVVSFANDSTISLRLTVDNNAVLTAVKTLHEVNPWYAQGSSVTVFHDDLRKVLEASSKKTGRQRVVFVMSDGENTSDEKLASLSDLQEYIADGAVLGYGTIRGGKMRVDSYGTGELEYLEDRTGSYPWPDAVSRIDEGNLRQMASELGLEYIHAEDSAAVARKIAEIVALREDGESGTEEAHEDIYYYFCWPLMAALVVKLYLAKQEYLE